MSRLRRVLVVLAHLAVAGCGTGVFSHRFEILVNDPSGRLGAPPIEMSLFNPQMGRSEEWARKTLCTASASAPCIAPYDTVETKLEGNLRPASRLTAALWLPAYERAGFFQFDLQPTTGTDVTIVLPFVPWNDSERGGARVLPLTARVRSDDNKRGAWNFRITLEIGPAEGPR